jgi:hypothetical protein
MLLHNNLDHALCQTATHLRQFCLMEKHNTSVTEHLEVIDYVHVANFLASLYLYPLLPSH